MDADLQPIYERIMRATRPEDVFREMAAVLPARLLAEHLHGEMEELRAVLDASRYMSFDDKEAAAAARSKLETCYANAEKAAARGIYNMDDYSPLGLEQGRVIRVQDRTYQVGEAVYTGAHATLYRGRLAIDAGSGGVVLRVAHHASDNADLYNEIKILDLLHGKDVGQWQYMPYLLDRFTVSDRVGIALRLFAGYSLEDVRRHPLHRGGLDQRHMVWVLDRMLSLLGYVHTMQVVHGDIRPGRIRVRPSNHVAMLSGWGGAAYKPQQTGETVVPAAVDAFVAPELRTHTPTVGIGPWTDIYGLGKSMIWLLGGDPTNNTMPPFVAPKLKQFLLNMVRENPRARPRDAWQLYRLQNRLKDSLWERRFRHLDMT